MKSEVALRVRGGSTPIIDGTDPTETNSWMTDGEALIRSQAKGDLYINQLKNADMAKAMFEQATYWKDQLKDYATTRGSSGFIVPTVF